MNERELRIDRRGLLGAGAMIGLAACRAPLSLARPRRLRADSLVDDDAIALSLRIRSGELSPLELLDVVVARIEALDGSLNALTTRTFERARERAHAVPIEGPLGGVPFLIKDMIDCAGVPRTDGADALFERTPKASPAYMQAVEASGVNIVGVTAVPEFATLPTTISQRFGATANPWDLSRTPAGSSGGSAAAVAAGYVPIAHATDGAGSIRMPASYCGVFGFKPTRARTVSGEADGRHDLVKHHHAISRSVRDSALLLSLTEDRGAAARYRPIGFVHEPLRRGLRIGIDPHGLFGLAPDAEPRRALESTAARLEAMGHEVAAAPRLAIDPEEFWRHLEAVFLARLPGLVRLTEQLTGQPFEDTSVLSPFTMSMARRAVKQPQGALDRARRYAATVGAAVAAQMRQVDILLSPVQPAAQPAIDVFSPASSFEVEAQAIREAMNYTALANLTGAPAMSVPLYWGTAESGGLPLGSHFMARPGEDALLLGLAYQCEEAHPWRSRWAPHSIAHL